MAEFCIMEAPMPDYYQILGLTINSTADEINDVCQKLIALHGEHRILSEDSNNQYIAVEEAYSVLSEPESREKYDAHYRSVSKMNGANNGWSPESISPAAETPSATQAMGWDVQADTEDFTFEFKQDSLATFGAPGTQFATDFKQDSAATFGVSQNNFAIASFGRDCKKVIYTYLQCSHEETAGMTFGQHGCEKGQTSCKDLVPDNETLNGFCGKCLLSNFDTPPMKAIKARWEAKQKKQK